MQSFINNKKLLFWDFDGVIKDSLDVKTMAFEYLFRKFGQDITNRIVEHHINNSGISRFEKIPLYLHWAKISATKDMVNMMCEQFSQLVTNQVINAPWVPGVESYLNKNSFNQIFVLVSATPKNELETIVNALSIKSKFNSIFGSPIHKQQVIKETMIKYKIKPEASLMIGDAIIDYQAARTNRIDFLLRKHSLNSEIFKFYKGPSIYDFNCLGKYSFNVPTEIVE